LKTTERSSVYSFSIEISLDSLIGGTLLEFTCLDDGLPRAYVILSISSLRKDFIVNSFLSDGLIIRGEGECLDNFYGSYILGGGLFYFLIPNKSGFLSKTSFYFFTGIYFLLLAYFFTIASSFN
jgi:hypothetical protein